eukprot:SAG11_NODE_1208_length_5521_cov_4.088528_5_plen_72_part_00
MQTGAGGEVQVAQFFDGGTLGAEDVEDAPTMAAVGALYGESAGAGTDGGVPPAHPPTRPQQQQQWRQQQQT